MGNFPLGGLGYGLSSGVNVFTGPYGVHRSQTRCYFTVGLRLWNHEDTENLSLSPAFGTGLGLWTSLATYASTRALD